MAQVLAGHLRERGIGRGDVCALIIRHNPIVYPLYMACVRAGAIPAILAYPNARLHPDKFRQGLKGMSQRSGLDFILSERELEEVTRPLVESEGSTIRAMHFPLEWHAPDGSGAGLAGDRDGAPGRITADDPLLLQHSSGTTGLQKPVLLSHGAVQRHVETYGSVLRVGQDDRIVSWLPLYHDMGLIAAFHLPLALGVPTVQIDPFEWVSSPGILLEAISREKGSIVWLPNFAYDLMADRISEDRLHAVRLDTLRLVINCSEPVRQESHAKFVARFHPYGLRPGALSACYAMAETTFAVTQVPPETPPTVVAVDRIALQRGTVRPSAGDGPVRLCVSSGPCIPGCEIRVVDDDGRELGDNSVGEIAIRSASLFEGYRNYPEKTAEVLRDGWYYSGDYGFRRGHEYFVVGRKKDVIIVAGNNIYPEDVEAAVGSVPGVIPGRVVAFGEEHSELGSERVAVIAETTVADELAQRRLRLEIVRAAMAIDVSIARVYLVPARFLIKSSAGKPSRTASRDRVMSIGEADLWRPARAGGAV